MNKATIKVLIAMLLWGSLGVFVKNISLDSVEIAFFRGIIGSVFLGIVLFIRMQNNKKLNQKLIDTGFVTSAQARLLPKDALEKLNIVPAPDSKVKDFLVDSNLKFPTNTNKDKEINILFISWNEN